MPVKRLSKRNANRKIPINRGVLNSIFNGFVIAGVFSFALYAFATPPDSPYAPGATLNPSCAPLSSNCTVTTPAISGVNTDITALSGLNLQAAIVLSPFGTSTGQTGEVRFLELAADGTNYVGFKSPDAISSSAIFTLPSAFPASSGFLKSSNAGVLSFDTGTYLATADASSTYVPYTGATAGLNLGSQNISTIGLRILESGDTPIKYSILQGGDQSIDLTYTLPTAYPGTGLSGFMKSSDAGVMSWDTSTYLTAAITSLNGLTGASQTFAIGTSGTEPAWGSATTTHTLNIPMASATDVTAGLLSKTDYNTFTAKQAALVSGTNIKTVNSTTLLGSGDIAVQPTLVSGTNIKSINGSSILASGDLTLLTSLSGAWLNGDDQTLLTGDKSGSFDLTTTGTGTFGLASILNNTTSTSVNVTSSVSSILSNNYGYKLSYTSTAPIAASLQAYNTFGYHVLLDLDNVVGAVGDGSDTTYYPSGYYSNVDASGVTFTGDGDTIFNPYGLAFTVIGAPATLSTVQESAIGIRGTSGGDIGTTGETSHYGGWFNAGGTADTNYGIFAYASDATTNWAGYFSGNMYVSQTGVIGIVDFGSSTGVSATATNGILTLTGLKTAGNNANLTFDFESTLNSVIIGSTSGVTSFSFSKNILVENAANPTIATVDDTNTVSVIQQSQDTIGIFGTQTNHALYFITNNTTALAIDTSQNFDFQDGNLLTTGSGTFGTGKFTASTNQIVLDSDGTYTGTITMASLVGSSQVWTFPGVSGTVALTANRLSEFASTTSEGLSTVIFDETGSGLLVFGTSPTLITPVLGVATATSINKVAITAPATGATLTIADGKTLTVNNTISLSAGADSKTLNIGANSLTFSTSGDTTLTLPTSGTVATGTGTENYAAYWSGTNTVAAEQYLAASRGGLGANITAAGGGEMLYSTSTTAYGHLAAGSSGQILRSGGTGAPAWSTATYPATGGTLNTLLRSDGTNWVNSTVVYPATTTSTRVLYSTSANTIGDNANLTFDGTTLTAGGFTTTGSFQAPTYKIDAAAPSYTYYDFLRGSSVTSLYAKSSATESDLTAAPATWITGATQITGAGQLTQFSINDGIVIDNATGYLFESVNWHGFLTKIQLPTGVPESYYSAIYAQVIAYWASSKTFAFYIWNYNTVSWEQIGANASGATLQDVNEAMTSNVGNYIGDDFKVYLMSRNVVSGGGDIYAYYDYTRIGVKQTQITVTSELWGGNLTTAGDISVGGIFSPSTISPISDNVYSNGSSAKRWASTTAQTVNAYNTFNLGSAAYGQAGIPFYVRLDSTTDSFIGKGIDLQVDYRNPNEDNSTFINSLVAIDHYTNGLADVYYPNSWKVQGGYDGDPSGYVINGIGTNIQALNTIKDAATWTADATTQSFYNLQLTNTLQNERTTDYAGNFNLAQLYLTVPAVYNVDTGALTGTVNAYGFISDADNIMNDNVKMYFGSGTDLSIYHNGTDSWIDNKTGVLKFAFNGTSQIGLVDGKLAPTTTNDIDLGDTTHIYKNAYITNYFAGSTAGVDGTGCTSVNVSKGIVISCTTSDIKNKKDIAGLGSVIDKVMALRGVYYSYDDKYLETNPITAPGQVQIGMIAEEMQQQFPELVVENPNGDLGINYSQFTAVLLEAVKELDQKINILGGGSIQIGGTGYVGGGQVSGVSSQAIGQSLMDLGMAVVNGVATLKEVVADKFTARTARLEKMEMIDSANGDAYCTWIENGEWQKTKGACDAIEEVVIEPTPEPAPEIETEPDIEITPEVQPEVLPEGSVEEIKQEVKQELKSELNKSIDKKVENIKEDVEDLQVQVEELSQPVEPEPEVLEETPPLEEIQVQEEVPAEEPPVEEAEPTGLLDKALKAVEESAEFVKESAAAGLFPKIMSFIKESTPTIKEAAGSATSGLLQGVLNIISNLKEEIGKLIKF
ncbi:MAG: tail fiber domain-containing protein [Candidatus Staskawiczbacteria bacterium]|jgi:hypothetical protein